MATLLPKADPAMAKQLSNGNLLCVLCNTQVKSKVWIAHCNGRKHRENAVLFKHRHLKRSRPECDDNLTQSSEKKPKADVEQIVQNSTHNAAPWENGPVSKMVESTNNTLDKNMINGVPEGFFEDEKLNSRVVDTIQKQANMEIEYANFMKELDEAKQAEEQREQDEEHVLALEHDIELINEQINQWRRVNQLELRREKLYNTTTEPCRKLGKVVEEVSDDDDADTDFSGWRSKGM